MSRLIFGVAPCGLLGVILLVGFTLVEIAAADQGDSSKIRKKHLIELKLSDQHATNHLFEFPRQGATVFLVASREGAELARRWNTALVGTFGTEIDIHGVASMGNVPVAFRSLAKSYIRGSTRDPVLLDWNEVFPKPVSTPLLMRIVRPCGSFRDVFLGEDLKRGVPRVAAQIKRASLPGVCLSCR